MKITTMHYTNHNKRQMVLVTFTEDDGGNTTSSVFTDDGWNQLLAHLTGEGATGSITITDES